MSRSPVSAASALADRQPPDLRLVGVALATWLSALAALHTTAAVALGTAGVAAAAAGLLWWCPVPAARSWWRPARAGRPWWRRGGPRYGTGHGWVRGVSRGTRWAGVLRAGGWRGVALALLLGVVCGSVATAARLAPRDSDPVAGPAHERAPVTAELTVRRDPRRVGGPAERPRWLVPARLHRLQREDGGPARAVRVRARILVLTDSPRWRPLLPGQRVRASGRLGPPRGGDLTAAVLFATGPPDRLGEPPWVQRAAGALRDGLQRASAPLPDEPGGLLPGLAIGDVRRLDPAVSDDFFATGLTHLVAVSGANVAIVVGCVVLVARAGRAPPWLTAAASGAALAGFVVLCRADPSVLRAAAMGAVALVALASGRPRAAVPALAATVTGLVVVDPQLAGEPGFALSVLATGGLLLLAPRWRDGLRRRGVPPGVAEAVAVPAAAQVTVAPVIAGLSGTVSPVAVVANLVATPAVAPATVLGVLAAVVAPVWLPAAELLAWLAHWPAWWLVLVARSGAQLPGAVLPWPGGVSGALLLGLLAVAGLMAMRHRRVRAAVAVAAAAVVVGALPVRMVAGGWPPAGAVVVMCAVGQGDLVVLPAGGGSAVVVDTGPEPAAADRCLRDLRVRAVPLLLVSHFHADHVGAVDGVYRGREVATVLAPGWPEPASGHAQLTGAAAEAGTPVRVARPGAAYQVGQVSLTVLGPPYPMSGTRSDPNNNSLVVRAEVRGVRVLLTGDAEVELQQALLERPGPAGLRAEVLKVAHHGSGYQQEAFLDAVDPAVALVPVGADNRHGHPSPEILADLTRGGARVLRTDTDGDLAAVLRDGKLAVTTRDPPPDPGR